MKTLLIVALMAVGKLFPRPKQIQEWEKIPKGAVREPTIWSADLKK